MAVYYKWIKGCASGASVTTGLWTYLSWGSGTDGVTQMPSLKVNTGKADGSGTDYGYMLTSKMPKPLIQTDIRANHAFYFTDINYTTENADFSAENTTYTWMQQTGNNVFEIKGCSGYDTATQKNKDDISTIKINCNEFFVNTEADHQVLKVNSYAKRFTDGVDIDGRLTIHDPNTSNGEDHNKIMLDVRGSTQLGTSGANYLVNVPAYNTSAQINVNATLNVNNKEVNALFFNATSDRRAKENIQLANYSALDLIKKLPIYTYNYKNHKENMTGILAQDLLKEQPDELDLVSNIYATGENNDYMSIKQDKLIFVLMKAIQEQQEEIALLKEKIYQLEQ